MASPKTFLLPLTAHATLPSTLLQAAAAAAASSRNPRVAFRIARAPDVSVAEQLVVQRLRQTHAPLFAETTDFAVDFAKPAELSEAMDGCDGVVVATALSDANAFEYESNLVEAAKASGSVQDVLKVSCPQGFLGETSGVAVGAQHWEIEQRVKQLQFEGNVRFVRPNTMMDTLLQGKLYEMICGRSLSVSVKHGRVAMVHPLDVADVLRALLDKPANAMGIPETYAVTGPEALSYQEIADQLSTGIGQHVTYSYFPLWAVQPSMWIRGERPEAIASEIQMARAIEGGAEQDVLPTVEDVVARQPHTLRQFIEEHQDEWPLRAYK